MFYDSKYVQHSFFGLRWAPRTAPNPFVATLKAGPHGAMPVVNEAENGLRHGSVINFKIIEDRVRFDVWLDGSDRHSIRLSSRLLTVANVVVKAAP